MLCSIKDVVRIVKCCVHVVRIAKRVVSVVYIVSIFTFFDYIALSCECPAVTATRNNTVRWHGLPEQIWSIINSKKLDYESDKQW